MARTDLTAQRLRELLHYDPKTGVFTRLTRSAQCVHIGEVVGWFGGDKHRRASVDRRTYLLHRLAWLYMTGEWPSMRIDHVDDDPINNAFANLRDVDRSTILQKQRKAHRGSKAGILGVSLARGRWVARMTIEGRRVHLGTFASAEEAGSAYREAKRRFHR
jgi:hypothetical protein